MKHEVKNKDKLIDELADTILRTWMFGGNPRYSSEDVFYHYGIDFDEDIYFKAMEIAGEQYDNWKKEINQQGG